jgi:hypothetical protein
LLDCISTIASYRFSLSLSLSLVKEPKIRAYPAIVATIPCKKVQVLILTTIFFIHVQTDSLLYYFFKDIYGSKEWLFTVAQNIFWLLCWKKKEWLVVTIFISYEPFG